MTKKRRLNFPQEEEYCNHPSVALSWVWDGVYHCWDCGELVGDDDDIEED